MSRFVLDDAGIDKTLLTSRPCIFFFFFNDTATTEIYTLSLHDALPICIRCGAARFLLEGSSKISLGARGQLLGTKASEFEQDRNVVRRGECECCGDPDY